MRVRQRPRGRVSFIHITTVRDMQNDHPMACRVDSVDDAPVTHAITKISSELAFEWFDVVVVTRIAPELLEAAVEPPLQGRVRAFEKTPRQVRQDKFKHVFNISA